jgi:hypothetical protein
LYGFYICYIFYLILLTILLKLPRIGLKYFKNMDSITATSAQDTAFNGFTVQSFGSLVTPDHPIRFGFQVDIVPSQCPRIVTFGLVAHEPANGGHPKTHGFAVRIDLESKEIWDLLNGSGLVGWLDHPGGLEAFTDEEPLLLGWEIDLHGQAMIPRLQLADQQWLYPTIHCANPATFEAIVGWSDDWHGDARSIFLHPALWREQLTVHVPQENFDTVVPIASSGHPLRPNAR